MLRLDSDELEASLLLPKVLITEVEDAAGDIQYGLENLPQQELVAALGTQLLTRLSLAPLVHSR